jgi:hypothetical protein
MVVELADAVIFQDGNIEELTYQNTPFAALPSPATKGKTISVGERERLRGH